MLRILCVRHGESDNVVTGAMGALPHAPLTERGHRQAVELANRLDHENITAIYASTARRAVQTAQPLADRRGLSIIEMSDLAEMHIGNREGARDKATRAGTVKVLRSWVVDGDWSASLAGRDSSGSLASGDSSDPLASGDSSDPLASGDSSGSLASGEPGTVVRDRVTGALRKIAERHPDQTVLVVSHVAALTVAVAALCPDIALWGRPLPHAEPIELIYAGGCWQCQGWPS